MNDRVRPSEGQLRWRRAAAGRTLRVLAERLSSRAAGGSKDMPEEREHWL